MVLVTRNNVYLDHDKELELNRNVNKSRRNNKINRKERSKSVSSNDLSSELSKVNLRPSFSNEEYDQLLSISSSTIPESPSTFPQSPSPDYPQLSNTDNDNQPISNINNSFPPNVFFLSPTVPTMSILDVPGSEFGRFIQLFTSNVYIPKPFLPSFRSIYDKYMTAALQHNDDISWRKLLSLPTILHSKPVSSMPLKERKERMNNNIRFLLKNDWSIFTFQYFFLNEAKKNFQSSKSEEQRIKTVMKYIKAGEVSKAVRAANSPLINSPHTDSTLLKLSSKFPPKYTGISELPDILWNNIKDYDINTDPDAYPISTTIENLEKILASKKRFISPGYDLLRFEHIKALFAINSTNINESIQSYRNSLTNIINTIISGNLPPSAASFLRGISLHAIPKKEGSDDIRPIGLQVLYRKIASSVINHSTNFQEFTSKHFSEIQYCLSSNGTEKITHCLQAVIDSNSDKDIFTPDASNAFNSLNIKYALLEVKKHFPSILPFLRQTYGTSSNAWYELILNSKPNFNSISGITKEEGVDQGCASASFMYSIGIHPILQEIKSIIGDDGFIKFFADDGNIVAPTDKMFKVINLISSLGLYSK